VSGVLAVLGGVSVVVSAESNFRVKLGLKTMRKKGVQSGKEKGEEACFSACRYAFSLPISPSIYAVCRL